MCAVSVLCASQVDRVTDISTSVQDISSVMHVVHVPQSNNTPPLSSFHHRILREYKLFGLLFLEISRDSFTGTRLLVTAVFHFDAKLEDE